MFSNQDAITTNPPITSSTSSRRLNRETRRNKDLTPIKTSIFTTNSTRDLHSCLGDLRDLHGIHVHDGVAARARQVGESKILFRAGGQRRHFTIGVEVADEFVQHACAFSGGVEFPSTDDDLWRFLLRSEAFHPIAGDDLGHEVCVCGRAVQHAVEPSARGVELDQGRGKHVGFALRGLGVGGCLDLFENGAQDLDGDVRDEAAAASDHDLVGPVDPAVQGEEEASGDGAEGGGARGLDCRDFEGGEHEAAGHGEMLHQIALRYRPRKQGATNRDLFLAEVGKHGGGDGTEVVAGCVEEGFVGHALHQSPDGHCLEGGEENAARVDGIGVDFFVVGHGDVVDAGAGAVDGAEDAEAADAEFLRDEGFFDDGLELAVAEGGKREGGEFGLAAGDDHS